MRGRSLRERLARVLFVGSALMVRSFRELRSVNPGFQTKGLLTFRLSPAPIRYNKDVGALSAFYEHSSASFAHCPV